MNKKQFEEIPEIDRFNCVLEGEAYYASVHTPNMSAVKKFNALPFFVVHLALDEAEQAKAIEMGLDIKDANDSIPKPHVIIKRKVKEGRSNDEVKPEVVDATQNPIPPAIAIGNGSKVIVKFATYWYEAGGGGIGTTLRKVLVKSLVPYEANKNPADAVHEDGFSVSEYVPSFAETADDFPVTVSLKKAAAAGGATNPNIFDD